MERDAMTLPQGWAWTAIGEVADIQSGVGFPKSLQGSASGDLPFAKVSDISSAVLNAHELLTSAANYLSFAEAKALHAKPLPAGTTLFAKIGEAVRLNRRAMAQIPVLVDNNVMGVIPDASLVTPKYLFHFWHTVDLYEYT
jgi:type I restriction enzyme S subunit